MPRKSTAEPAQKVAGRVKAGIKTAARTKPAAKPAAKTVAKAAARALPKAASKPAAPRPAPKAQACAPAAARAALVRDSFTMPEQEYAVLAEVKRACLKAGFEVKKSELLRIGVALLGQVDVAALRAVLASLPQLKTGRPPGR